MGRTSTGHVTGALRERRTWLVGATVTALVLGSVTACSGSAAANSGSGGGGGSAVSSSGGSSGDLVVGVVASLTGPFAAIGKDQVLGVQAEADLLNQKGGILGHHVKVVTRDSGSDVQRGVSATQQLLSSTKVNVFIPDAINATSELPLAKDVLTTSGCTSVQCSDGKTYPLLFTSNPGGAAQVAGVVAYAKQQHYGKIGVIATDQADARDFATSLSKQAKPLGIDIVDTEFFAPTATNVTSQLQKIKAAGAEAVLGWTSGATLGPVATGLRDLGWKAPYIGLASNFTGDVNQLVPSQVADQVTCVCFAAMTRQGPTLPDTIAPLADAASKHGQITSFLSLVLHADALAIAAYGFTKAGSLDPQKAAAALDRIGSDPNYPGDDFYIWRDANPDYHGDVHAPIDADLSKGFFAIAHPSEVVQGTFLGTPFTYDAS